MLGGILEVGEVILYIQMGCSQGTTWSPCSIEKKQESKQIGFSALKWIKLQPL